MVQPQANTILNRRQTRWKRVLPYAYISPTVFLLVLLMLVPIAMVIGYSFLDNVIVTQESKFVGISNYVTLLSDGIYWEAVVHTCAFTAASVAAHMVISILFALMLNSKLLGKAGKAVFRVIYILPWVFTIAVVAIVWKLLLNPNGIVNYLLASAGWIEKPVEWLASRNTAMFSVMLINIWCGYPFYMVSILAGLQGIAVELYEAATVDGASGFQKFFRITLPQLKSIIVSMAMMDIIWTAQQFGLIWMTTGGGPVRATEMVSTYTYKLAFTKYQFSIASASAVILLLASMCLSMVYVRTQKARD